MRYDYCLNHRYLDFVKVGFYLLMFIELGFFWEKILFKVVF